MIITSIVISTIIIITTIVISTACTLLMVVAGVQLSRRNHKPPPSLSWGVILMKMIHFQDESFFLVLGFWFTRQMIMSRHFWDIFRPGHQKPDHELEIWDEMCTNNHLMMMCKHLETLSLLRRWHEPSHDELSGGDTEEVSMKHEGHEGEEESGAIVIVVTCHLIERRWVPSATFVCFLCELGGLTCAKVTLTISHILDGRSIVHIRWIINPSDWQDDLRSKISAS